MNTKSQAEKAGRAALKRMKTPGWKLHVWENAGWHWCLEQGAGHLTVRPCRGGFFAMLSLCRPSVGDTRWTDDLEFLDPNHAAEYTVAKAKSVLKKEQKNFERVARLMAS